MLQTLVLKILYLACKLRPDSSPEPEPVGASTLFVIIAVILKVVRIFLLHRVDLYFIFLKPNFCFQGSANLWPQKAWSYDGVGGRERREDPLGHVAQGLRASPACPRGRGSCCETEVRARGRPRHSGTWKATFSAEPSLPWWATRAQDPQRRGGGGKWGPPVFPTEGSGEPRVCCGIPTGNFLVFLLGWQLRLRTTREQG